MKMKMLLIIVLYEIKLEILFRFLKNIALSLDKTDGSRKPAAKYQ